MKNKLIIILTTVLVGLQIQAQEIVLPFKLYENKYVLLKLPVENRKDSLTFYFDTGASSTLLDKTIAKKFNITPNNTTNIQGASGNKSYELALNQKIQLTKEHAIDSVSIILEDLSRLNSAFSSSFDGIIGNDIIKNYITKIDFDKREIHLYKKKTVLDTKDYTEIPFTFKNNIEIPQFPISIELTNGEKLSGDILFDSGAGLSLLINTPFQKKHDILKKSGKYYSITTDNLSDKTVTIVSKVKKVAIGNFTFKSLPFLIASDKEGVSSFDGYLGILGSEIINRFNIILDYDTHKLYLKPNSLYNNKFEINVNPLKLKKSADEIIISSVVKNSVAEKAGLKAGQKIIAINGISTTDINSYNKELNKENKKVTIEYLDDKGKSKKVKIRLKKLI